MKILKFAFLAMILFADQSFAAGLKNKVPGPDKEIQSIQEDENKEIKKISRGQPMRIDWNKELDLDDEQSAYVANIYKKSHEKIAELMNQIKDIHRQIDELHKQDEEQIKRILTPQQQIKYEKVKRRISRNRGEKPDIHRPSRKKMKEF